MRSCNAGADCRFSGAGADRAQPGVAAVQQTNVGIGGNQRDVMALQPGAAQQVTFLAQRGQRGPVGAGQRRRACRLGQYDGAVAHCGA